MYEGWASLLKKGGSYVRVCLLEGSRSMDKNVLLWLAERKEIDQVLYLKSELNLMTYVKSDMPDIVMIHLGTNKNNGLLLGEKIKGFCETIKVIFISDDTGQALNAFDVGASGYLIDPLDKSKFERCINKLVHNF
jgi:two-component SAPR family response regulator